MASKLIHPTDRAIHQAHRRYVQLMESERLGSISHEDKTDYLTALTSLIEKLAIPTKPLEEIMSEMAAEVAPVVWRMMQR